MDPVPFFSPVHRLCISLYFHAHVDDQAFTWVIPIQELGLQKTRVCIARNRRRARWKRDEINEGRERVEAERVETGRWRGCIKASAQSEMFAGQKPTRPKICFGKWRARELVESRKKKLNPLAKTRQMESMDGRQRHLVTRAH